MYAAHRPSLRAVMRVLAIAVVLTLSLSAVSIAYAAGRHAGHHGESELRSPPAERAVASEAWG
jgi:hypothetical protein